ncbi:MAG TPA: M48 family metalloprotease [Candidatus Brocadiia bacterium]|nr:M48 family metalloprotease [Candidatus Brocadiia bacterium]
MRETMKQGARPALAAGVIVLVCAAIVRAEGGGEVRTVVSEFAKIVKGPGAFYDTVGVVQKGSPIETAGTDETGRWVKVTSYPKSKGQPDAGGNQEKPESAKPTDAPGDTTATEPAGDAEDAEDSETEPADSKEQSQWISIRSLSESKSNIDSEELQVAQTDFQLDESFTAYAIRGYDSNVADFMSAENVPSESIEFLLAPKFTARQYLRFKAETMKGRDLPVVWHISETPVPLDDMTAESMGAIVARKLAEDLRRPYVKDPALLAYVNMLAQWLVEQTPRYDMKIRVIVVEDETPNSFATPGGFIVITTGILDFCRNEAELANVLAHELVHIWRQHGLLEREAIRKRLKMDIVGLEAELDAELEKLGREPAWKKAQFKELNALAYEFLSKTLLSKRRIQDEDQADTYGLIFAYKAGYDPAAARDMMARLAEKQGSFVKEVFLNHATPEQRIEQVDWTIKKLELNQNKGALLEERYKARTGRKG